MASFAVGALGCAASARPAAQDPNAKAGTTNAPTAFGSRPPFVVSIVVDQLAAWVADERVPTLPESGGFARLRREGTWVHDVRYDHAVTDTAPGHASLYTGTPPRASGIVANELVDESTGKRVSFLRDPRVRVVSRRGTEDLVGASIAALRVPSFADRLRARRPETFVASFSLKDRGAIFAGGTRPDASIWFDTKLDTFVTSTAFADHLPGWLGDTVEPSTVARLRERPWQPDDLAWLRAHAKTADASEGEGDLEGLGVTFPHFAARAKNPAVAFRATPGGDRALLGMALRAADEAKRRNVPGLLAISFSSNDYVGHAFGPDSWEAWDELRSLDATLAELFGALDRTFGPEGWAALLTADHGTVSMPEARHAACGVRPHDAADPWERPCGDARSSGRIVPDELRDSLRAALRGAALDPSFVAGVADPYVHLSSKAEALPASERAALLRVLVAALSNDPHVGEVFDPRMLPATCPPPGDTSVAALVCRSSRGDVRGALYVTPKRGSFFDASVVVGKGTSHGSPYLFDRMVPLFVRSPRAPSTSPAPRDVRTTQSFASFDATLADLFDVDPTDRSAPSFADARRSLLPGRPRPPSSP
ncbi:MAG: alkaline phosphatase family protein [Polyangiaceae bacterium]